MIKNMLKKSKKIKKIVFVLGIRPDLIRASLIIKFLRRAKDIKLILVWSGQNYSYNLKGIFFRQLRVHKPDIEIDSRGNTDAEVVSKLIAQLYPLLEKLQPEACIFLGDTNTAMGCIAAAQLNIPIIHVEGCWHSYDWRMPEEKIRTLADHLADVIYTYEKEYKNQGIAGGLSPKNIVVVRNPIVDILNEYYFKQKKRLERMASSNFFSSRKIKDGRYYLMTCHRRENVHILKSFKTILNLVSHADSPVYFPASYRTQRVIKAMKVKTPKNLVIVNPVGYEEILILITHAKGVITDSGTIVEETCILNIPAINIRKSTERPQIYDVKSCVKFDPDQPNKYPPKLVLKKLAAITGKRWKHTFGDGRSSERIAKDIIKRLRNGNIRGHLSERSHVSIRRPFMEDGIKV